MNDIPNRVQIKAAFFELIGKMYAEACSSIDYSDNANKFFRMIEQDLINNQTITEASLASIDIDIKNSYLTVLSILA